jgi:superfamily II DNA or RNA helicase
MVTTTRSAWAPDPGLIQEVRALFESAIASYRANPNLIAEHANHEESIRVGGYANRTLLELVQNAADAMSGVSEREAGSNAGRVEIVLDADSQTLYCANAGRPFSKKGLTAIMHAHLSGKRGDEIGRFGLGFKSVLAVTDAPQVFSRSVSFEFNSAEARAAIADVDSSAKRYPILRAATLIDPTAAFNADPTLAELAEWAVTIVKLPHASNLKRLRKEIEEFSSEFLLFVSSVREVHLRVLGNDGLETSHVSRDLGNGLYKIERPDANGGEWLVEDRMHTPSAKARHEVGEAVSRHEVKVTVAVPVRNAQQRVGRFWSYFPLQDHTSASALFNAPWSVNDDRTTLLRNDYNREILGTLTQMFVDVLPRVNTNGDPAAHLDYLPARGREERSFGDGVLCAQVPRLSSEIALIPDARGEMRHATELRPLDFAYSVDETIHHAWIESPNTGDDVPHWRSYSSPQRVTRLRQLFAVGFNPDIAEEEGRDMKRALELMPKRGLLSWLREWAEGADVVSAANALKFVAGQLNLDDIEQAKVIPTTSGLRALADRSEVFLEQEEGIDIEGAVFVDRDFLAQPRVEEILRKAGFRNLDPVAILNARLARLSASSGDEDLSKFWDAVLGVSVRDAVERIKAHPRAPIKVPTRDFGWAWPQQVFDVDLPLQETHASITLDRQRCLPEVAYAVGVIRTPVEDYDFEDELLRDEYRAWVVESLNSALGPGARPIERIELYPGRGPGPFSILITLRDAGASEQSREKWTRELLAFGDKSWDGEDVDSGTSYTVQSPVRWAVTLAGIVDSTQGFRAPDEVVDPSLVRYQALLPLYRGPRAVAEVLELPDELDSVPASVYRRALEADLLPPSIDDDVLTEFILTATRVGYAGSQPPRIPARVGRAVEARSPKAVYVAVTDEQRDFLASRQRPFLRATEERAADLVATVGCQRFENSFGFSMLIEGEQASDRVLDLYTGLRGAIASESLTNATVTRAASVIKRVTTEDGVEDQSLEWHLDGLNLFVSSDVDEKQLLSAVNEAYELQLTNADLANVLKAGLNQRLEQLRQEALAASSDIERLEIYFGPDDLRDELPKGLWQALEAESLVDGSTSVADLYLTVYGSDSIRLLADRFRNEGFPDVPNEWAGGASTISWLRRMGFGTEFAGRRAQRQADEFVVPGAVKLSGLHRFQQEISAKLRPVLIRREANGRALKAMLELPTGAGKTRVASETVLRLFIEGEMRGPVLWIAQSQELCEQAVQTWETVWRGLGDERPLTIGRLWENNVVHEPDTEFSVIVATDAKLDVVLKNPDEYAWLSNPAAVVVDEGHRAGDSARYTRILSWLGVAGRGWERPLIGLSATPFKGHSERATAILASRFGNRKLAAFEANAYDELAKIGVLARVQHEVLTGVDVELSASELDAAESRRRLAPNVLDRIGRDQARMRTLVNHILAQDPSWPVLVFTPSVLSAQVLAAMLRYRDVEAASVSGQTGRQARREVIERFKSGEIRVLANCDLLVQGFDAPGVMALYIARPTFSPNAYIQMAGRGLRGPANGGKAECLIVDMADNFGDINNLLGFRQFEDLWREQSA